MGFGAPGLRLRAENVLQRKQGSKEGLKDWGLGVWEVEFRNKAWGYAIMLLVLYKKVFAARIVISSPKGPRTQIIRF